MDHIIDISADDSLASYDTCKCSYNLILIFPSPSETTNFLVGGLVGIGLLLIIAVAIVIIPVVLWTIGM